MNYIVPLAIFLGSCSVSAHYGVLTLDEETLERFFKCIDSIESADKDGNNRISEAETPVFLDTYSKKLYGESVLVVGGSPPENMASSLFSDLVKVSKPLEGVTEIDVYGYKLSDMPIVTDQRLQSLHAVCQKAAHAIMKHGHQTEPPQLFRLDEYLKEEEEEEEAEERNGGRI
ncbi:expressed unknown protein [Seminavis robusta]|uniref:EF-hand domain-containing protein n=1 Tax=Seminavis robusta TaxID=568900 RepID=A0A9N8E8Y5_9STRA|nr:expressed unknown protein [Seminavis robusta]|eukprot:Sro815_g206570.1 n/a (173) ;mRNA; f:40969-41749